jgi:ABC-type multidrug transport system fused ATPase/permease subunit
MLNWFERQVNPFDDATEQQPPKGIFAFCRFYTKGFEKPLLLLSLFSALIAFSEVILISYLGDLVDLLSQYDKETFWREQRGQLISMCVLLFALPLMSFLHSMLMHQTILGNYPMAVAWRMHRYLLNQSMSFFHNDFSGRIATKVLQSSMAVRETIMKLLNVLVYVTVYFGSIIWLVGSADLMLMIPLLIWLFTYIVIQLYFTPKFKQAATLQADARSHMSGRIVDAYTNVSSVKLFAHTQRELSYAKDSMKRYLHTVYRQMRLVTAVNFSVDISNYLLLLAISVFSLLLWFDQLVTLGAIAVAISISLRIQGMSKWIMWEIGSLFENIGTVVDGMKTLSNKVDVVDAPDASALHVSRGEIHFDKVIFNYNADNTVFNQLDFTISPGEKVGIVGRSGAGKSTLVNLLLRFYNLKGGAITIDGQNIAAVTQDSLRQHIGMITQDTSLLHRTIKENIAYGNPEASDQQIIEAAKKAHAHDFISSLKDKDGQSGYDVLVGERGVKLSGGQRQRIAIARVLLKNAPILVMDEATSALDSEVETAIQENLEVLMNDKTVIAIAHRLSTIAAMDRLIVMDQGRIVETGSHQQLLDLNGIYAQLWRHQTGAFLV